MNKLFTLTLLAVCALSFAFEVEASCASGRCPIASRPAAAQKRRQQPQVRKPQTTRRPVVTKRPVSRLPR